MTPAEVDHMVSHVEGWEANDEHEAIFKGWKFKDFREAMVFVNKVAEIAESEGHHPDFLIKYNNVNLKLWTHAINGLSENDFIMAAKIDAVQ